MRLNVCSFLFVCLAPGILFSSDKEGMEPDKHLGLAGHIKLVLPAPSVSTTLKPLLDPGATPHLPDEKRASRKRKAEDPPSETGWMWNTVNIAQMDCPIRLETDKQKIYAGLPDLKNKVQEFCRAVQDPVSCMKFLTQFLSPSPNNPFNSMLPAEEGTNVAAKLNKIQSLWPARVFVSQSVPTPSLPFDAAYQHLDEKLSFVHQLLMSTACLPFCLQHSGFSCIIDKEAACDLRLIGPQQFSIFPPALQQLRPALKLLIITNSGLALSPLTLDTWDRLETLILSNNLLQHVTLNALPSLTKCRLDRNQLTSLELGNADTPLQALTVLDISHNKLTNLPPLPLTLTSLLMSHNLFKLSSLQPLHQYTQLRTLDLSWNSFSPLAPKQTAIELPKLLPASLTALGVASLDLRSTPDFTGHTSLRVLSLSENPLPKVSHESLPTVSLETLHLNSNITPVEVDVTNCEKLTLIGLTHLYNLGMVSRLKVPSHPLAVHLSPGSASQINNFALSPNTEVKIIPGDAKTGKAPTDKFPPHA